jgi:hypothetical protein
LKDKFNVKAMKAAAIEIEEKFLSWKAYQFDRLANQARQDIIAKARSGGVSYFMETAKRIGLHFVHWHNTGTKSATTLPPACLAGRKCSASGSTTDTSTTPNAVLAVALASPSMPYFPTDRSDTPRGRPATLTRGRS